VRIGIDFDNTIAEYDDAFALAAREARLIDLPAPAGKREIRRAIRKLDDGERKWMRLQGEVYGKWMSRAVVCRGMGEFLRRCRRRPDVEIFIVSHKTEFGHFDGARVNLRDAARAWMEAHAFFSPDGFGIPARNLYFESTREAKLERISELRCSHFIDDLEEVLNHPRFPVGVDRILFTNGGKPDAPGTCRVCGNWAEIEEVILGSDG